MIEKQWMLPPDWQPEISRNREQILEWLLTRHGAVSKEQRDEFLSEKPQETYDPFLLKGMTEAVDAILEAADSGKSICIYGDYDADGVTACSLMVEVLSLLTANVQYYIPSRFEEGYGLNAAAVEKLAEQGTELLITVDCGSVSKEEVQLAQTLGMQVIVTDHHSMQEGRSAECILINPKQMDCPYPFKELCGCGVAFKLAQALQRTLDGRGDSRFSKQQLNRLLDLVAISTVGDIVPLVSENRTLVKHGLRCINKKGRPGLDLLVGKMGLKPGQIDSTQIAYGIVPHLNAGGRMLTAETGVRLLTGAGNSEDEAQLLVDNNQERKTIQEKTYQQCLQIAQELNQTREFLLIRADDAHEGIAGIVAGKIKDHFGKPAVIVTETGEEGTLKGTGRSVDGVNLFQLLDGHRELFLRFGGHSGACGFSIKPENLEQLYEKLEQDMKKLLEETPFLLQQKVLLDAVLPLQLLNLDLIKQVQRMAPFGFGNENPVFLVEDLTVLGVKYMGNAEQHVRFTAKSKQGRSCDFILFGKAQDFREILESGEALDVAGYPDVNVWNGRTKIQFIVRDGRKSKWTK